MRWRKWLGVGTAISDLSVAVDEIYALRVMLADEADTLEQHLALKTFPKSRRAMAEASIARMRQAARGDFENAQRPGVQSKSVLQNIGAEDTLTNWEWAAQRGLEEDPDQ